MPAHQAVRTKHEHRARPHKPPFVIAFVPRRLNGLAATPTLIAHEAFPHAPGLAIAVAPRRAPFVCKAAHMSGDG